jgi:hypothetical protein
MAITDEFDWAEINAENVFTRKDWVTNKLPNWIPLLEPLRNCPLSILEVGSADGRSALFFLSLLPNARITCIDPFRVFSIEIWHHTLIV